jgi:hypothetical protein
MGRSIIISSRNPGFIAGQISAVAKELNLSQSNLADFLEILAEEGKLSMGIEKMRDLKAWAVTKPFASNSKLAVIKAAETLTEEAQNSILKILEEPNLSTTIILTTQNYNSLLATIISRCEIITDGSMEVEEQIKTAFWENSIREKFVFIEKILANRNKQEQKTEVDSLCKSLLKINRELLLKGKNPQTAKKNIRLISDALLQIKANVSLRLALENLIINLDKI